MYDPWCGRVAMGLLFIDLIVEPRCHGSSHFQTYFGSADNYVLQN